MLTTGSLQTQLRLLAGISVAVLLWRLVVVKALGITLYIDEAQYWTWAQQLDWGYFSKPPGVALLIAASTAVFGDGVLGVKALSMLCYIASAWLAWAIARRLFDDETAFWSAVVVLTVPMFAWLGLFVSTDALLTLFWLAALLVYLRILETGSRRDWLLLGLICGLGLMSKYTMVFWMLAALLHLAVFARHRLTGVGPWAALGIALLLLAPNIWWNVANDFPTLRHTADITVNKRASGGFASLGEFLAAQWIAFGPVLGSLFVALLASFRSSWRNDRFRLLLWFAMPLWIIVSFQALRTSANANWAAPAFAPAAIAVVAWLLQRGWRQVLAAGLAVNLLIVGVVYHWPQLLALAGEESARLDPYARARGWDALAGQLRPLLVAHPGSVLVADNRTVMAHLLYELRDLDPPSASWDPQRLKNDHYKLTTDLNHYRGRDLIFVTRTAPPPAFADNDGAQPIATLSTSLAGDRVSHLQIWLLRDFKGY